MRYIVLDLESYRIDNAADYLTEPVDAPSNYTKPDAIAKYVAEAKQKQLDKAALDIDLARIVALGWRTEDGQRTTLIDDLSEQTESRILQEFWEDFFPPTAMGKWHTLITFNGMGFDVPLLLRRSLYLGVKAPKLQIDRYRHPEVIDLMALLNYGDKSRSHSLAFYCQRFGIPVNDENSGKDIAALIAADNWQAVEAHCASDVAATYALAKRMGVIGG